MAKPAKCLLIGSTEAHSGKSTTTLGIMYQLGLKGILASYCKPLGSCDDDSLINANPQNIDFLANTLGLTPERWQSQNSAPFMHLNAQVLKARLIGEDVQDYSQQLCNYLDAIKSPFVLLEGPNNLSVGNVFSLSADQIAATIDASILLVTRYNELSTVANLLAAKKLLGNRLLGVVINDVPESNMPSVEEAVKPYLEQSNIPVLGTIPRDRLLNSVSVREFSKRLKAQVLCCSNRLDLMVESLTIGAMNVNSALEYFRQRTNMVVITGSDRTDLQMAALETATNCLILTGHVAPKPFIVERAEHLEIPILAVDSDTLTTVEVVDAAFGRVPIRESVKVKRVIQLMEKHFDCDRLIDKLALESMVTI